MQAPPVNRMTDLRLKTLPSHNFVGGRKKIDRRSVPVCNQTFKQCFSDIDTKKSARSNRTRFERDPS